MLVLGHNRNHGLCPIRWNHCHCHSCFVLFWGFVLGFCSGVWFVFGFNFCFGLGKLILDFGFGFRLPYLFLFCCGFENII
jgi:hypothetical protein